MPFVKFSAKEEIARQCEQSPTFKKIHEESRKRTVFHKNYTTYTSQLCHSLKDMGDIDFINNILDMVEIEELLEFGHKKHALYTVALIDYVCKENNIPLKPELDKYRDMRMEVLSYPSGVETYTRIVNGNDMKEKALANAIPEFLKYNIVETSIRNII